MSDVNENMQPDLLAVEPQTDVPCYFLELTVENVRSFGDKQTLDLSDGQGRPAQWVILLGDNGAGKTTLLQCLAAMNPRTFLGRSSNSEKPEITYYGPDILLSTGDDDEKYRSFLRVGSEKLKISVQLGYGTKLGTDNAEFHNDLVSIERGAKGVGGSGNLYQAPVSNFLVYAYGATRRIGNVALSESRESDPRATLFDENCALLNAEEWLLQADYAAVKSNDLNAAARRDRIKEILIRLLPEVDDLRIQTSGSHSAFVEVLTPFGWVAMRALSTGYRSVVAWMVDLASRLFDRIRIAKPG